MLFVQKYEISYSLFFLWKTKYHTRQDKVESHTRITENLTLYRRFGEKGTELNEGKEGTSWG